MPMTSTNAALSEFNAKIPHSNPGAKVDEIHYGLSRRLTDTHSSGKYQSDTALANSADRYLVRQCRLNRAERIIKARSRRLKFFPKEMFTDPVWDIFLELTRGELADHRVSISSLSSATNVPPTTALRYIASLTAQGMLLRRPDPLDGRRVFVELSQPALDSMFQYLDTQQ
jgi:DNA-binding MarR family transcriptional regulator